MAERRLRTIAGGGAALAAGLAAILALRQGAPVQEAAVEIVPAAEREAAPAPVEMPAAEAPPPPSAEGLVLHGLTATGAILGSEGGGQRLVRIGGEVRPGLKLKAVRQHVALLEAGGATLELGFAGPMAGAAAAVTPAPAPAVAAASPTERARREETLRYRMGLAPRRAGGRITGFTLRAGAEMPLLRRAGLQPGDVLVAVNGQAFESEEKVAELASEIAGSYTAEFEFERGGRRMRASLEVNPRPTS